MLTDVAPNQVLNAIEPTILGDLNADGVANQADMVHLLQDMLGTVYGDANLDLTVSFTDFTDLQIGYGQPGGWANGNFNGDGQITFADFAILQTNFGMTVAPAAVPEPTTLALFALASLTLLRRRRGA